MSRKISSDIRRQVEIRADYRCEYCLIRQDNSAAHFQIVDIQIAGHAGHTDFEFALSCPNCYAFKEDHLGMYVETISTFVLLFNPRTDLWDDHFEAIEGVIHPKTHTAEVTINIFQLNDPDRIILRQELAIDRRWP